MFFERKNVLKRNVATRQPARDVGQVLQDGFEFELDIFIIHCIYITLGLKVNSMIVPFPRTLNLFYLSQYLAGVSMQGSSSVLVNFL